MADIKRLLNKKGWTGRELGIIELTNMAVLYRQARNGEPQKPIVEEEQFQKMLSGIKDRHQGQIYNGYISIHEWLSIQYNIAQTQLQQAQLQYRTLEGYITQAILAEDVFSYVEQLPAIMTPKQYEDAKAEGLDNLFKDEDGEELLDGIPLILDRVIEYFLDMLQKDPKGQNPLKEIRKQYVNEPVKSKIILDRWNEVTGEGYYTLQDGRRSDQMTAEEWQAAVMSPKLQKALRDMEASNGEGTEYTEAIAIQRVIQRNRVIFNGGTEEEADKAQERLTNPCEWHYYTEPPTDLTKWDVIEQIPFHGFTDFYPASFDGEDPYNEDNYTSSMEDLRSEFPELITALFKAIDESFSNVYDEISNLPEEERKGGLSNLPVSKWGCVLFSERELYNKDFFGIRAEEDSFIFKDNPRVFYNGVAIFQQGKGECYSKGTSRRIDEKGYYMEPVIESSLADYSLEAFFTESEDYATNVDIVESSRSVLLSSYYLLMGYNYTIDRIAAIHDVPELEVFKFDLKPLDERIDGLNDLVPTLYRRIKDTNYSDQERKERKLQVLRDFFQPIEYKALAIPEANKEEADTLIADFTAFKQENSERFYNLLSAIPDGTGEGA